MSRVVEVSMDARRRRRHTMEEIYAHADDLAPEHVRILRLSAQGFDPKGIAADLGLPHGTAKSRLSRARNALDRRIAFVAARIKVT